MAPRTAYRASKDTPKTLTELIRKGSPILWTDVKYQKTQISNLMDADDIMGRPSLSDINTDMVDYYIRTLKVDLKNGSVNRKLNSLHKLLKYAYEREWIAKMPVFGWLKEDNERIRWLTVEEEKGLLEVLPKVDKTRGEQIAALCEILLHTGCRRDEIRTAQPDQLDGNYLRLWKTKTKRPRSVPLTDRAKELLQAHLPFDLTRMQIHRAWIKAKKELGLEHDDNFVLHTLRHTTATRLLDTTGNIVVVSKLLGHSKLTTTMRYAHLSDEGLLDSIRLTAKKYDSRDVNL